MSKKNAETLGLIQQQIHSGDLHSARRLIQGLEAARLDRADRLGLAYMSRRCFQPEKAVELLYRIVRSDTQSSNAATQEERAEYAMALAELADSREALAILSTIDIQKLPRVFLGLTMVYFRSWEWDTALPIIQRFLARPLITLTERLQATYCLGTALLHGFEDYGASQTALEEVLRESKKHDYPELHRDARMMLAQNLYYQRDFRAAETLLGQIQVGIADGPDQSFALTVAQLRAAIQIRTARDKNAGLKALHEIRAKFQELHRSFNVRNCDFTEVESTGNPELLIHLYFGTPLPGAARKFERFFKLNPQTLPASYHWPLPIRKPRSGRLAVLNGANSFSRATLKAGQLPQRLLQALSLDFYKAPNTPEIHERIYPGEFFNPVTSGLQVRQSIFRLRRWFNDHHLPLEVAERRGTYCLSPQAPISIIVPRPLAAEKSSAQEPSPRCAELLRELKQCFTARAFSANEAAKLLQLSNRSMLNYLKEALAHKAVEQVGSGPRTRYRIG